MSTKQNNKQQKRRERQQEYLYNIKRIGKMSINVSELHCLRGN